MIKENFLISILIPCYNGEKYIDTCLQSCVNQTYKNIEIIVINDGSTDKSELLLEQWTKKDKRIKYYYQKNSGLGETRNILIEKANGQFFSFVDIDDTIPENAMELLALNSNDGNNDIIVGRSRIVYHSLINDTISLPFFPSWRHINNMSNGHYVKSNICTPWACLIKKEYFLKQNIKFIRGKVFEDFGVMTYLFLNTKKFYFIKNIVYNYHKYKINNNIKPLSAFNDLCYKKIDDIYSQSKQLFNHLDNNKLFLTKQYKRYINGVFYQILPANIFLSQNLTPDKYIRYILRYNLTYFIYKMGREIRYSKTFWKSITFFFLYIKCGDVINDIKNNTYNRKFIKGQYLIKNQKYKYVIKKYNKDNFKKDLKYTIYEINDFDIDQVRKEDIEYSKLSTFITLSDKEQIRQIFKRMYYLNVVPFVSVNSSLFDIDFVIWLSKYVLGINLICENDTTLTDKESKIIERLNNLERKKIIYVTCSSDFDIQSIRNKIDGVFRK